MDSAGRAFECPTYAGSVEFSANPYTGDHVDHTHAVPSVTQCGLSRKPTPSIWNRVELRATTSTGLVEVLIDGTAAASCATLGFPADTAVSITVGLQAIQQTTAPWTVYFDNIEVSIRRR